MPGDSTTTACEPSGSEGTPHVLEAVGLVKHFRGGGRLPLVGKRQVVHAVDGINLSVPAGKTMSLVGESGCGKSTTARLLLDLDEPTAGEVRFRGRTLGELSQHGYREYRLAVQAVFQNPSSALNPRRRVHQSIAEPLIAAAGIAPTERQRRVRELLDKVGLDKAVSEAYPHELSGGMRQRVVVAQALATNPAVIVLDEPVSALDVSIRAQIMNLLKDVQDESGVGYLLIAHDLATVRYLSHRVAAMYLGLIVEEAAADAFFREPLHPYTMALISAAIPIGTDEDKRERIVLQGDTPSPSDPPRGCRFHTRCWLKRELGDPEKCVTDSPVLETVSGTDHKVACHFIEDGAATTTRRRLLARLHQSSGTVTTPLTRTDSADAI